MAVRLFGLIPAAGSGSRLLAGARSDSMPKQYLPLGPAVAGESDSTFPRAMLWHSLQALLAAKPIEQVLVVLSPGDARFRELDLGEQSDRVVPLYCGGASRRDSVLNGLIAGADLIEADDWVLVHDAARPCLGMGELNSLIGTVLGDADSCGGILALPVADTLKRASSDVRQGAVIETTVARERLWQAQTPQMFRYGVLLDALQQAPTVSDEASAIEALGLAPRLIEGNSSNLKVTYAPDLALAAAILHSQGRI